MLCSSLSPHGYSIFENPLFRLYPQMARTGRNRRHVRRICRVRADKLERRAIGREYAQVIGYGGLVLPLRRYVLDLRSKGNVGFPVISMCGADQRAGAGEIDRLIAANNRLHGSARKYESQIMRVCGVDFRRERGSR